jgi:uncharacterized iron-regulated membrane protein
MSLRARPSRKELDDKRDVLGAIMTALLRWTIRIHKWLALIVGIQIVLWIAGGVVMSVIPIEQVRGEHNIAEPEELAIDPAELISLAEAAQALELETGAAEIRLQAWQGQPVYNVYRPDWSSSLVDARTGEVITPISRERAISIALADYAGTPDIAAVEFFEEPTWEYRRAGSAWRISFADGEGTRIYVSPDTGLVMARRNDDWRFFDFFWMLHIMDYQERENFNNPLLITASIFALFTVLAGLLLLVMRLQRLVHMELAKRRQSNT